MKNLLIFLNQTKNEITILMNTLINLDIKKDLNQNMIVIQKIKK